MTQSQMLRFATGTPVLSAMLLALGCTQPASIRYEPAPPPPMQSLMPGLRIAPDRGLVEFDGTVAVDVHHPDTPDVYLELIVTGPNAREHEALVVTSVPPSMIHAALLAAGHEHGEPGRFFATPTGLMRQRPTGDELDVLLVTANGHGEEVSVPPEVWMRAEGGRPLMDVSGDGDTGFRWIFAGSRVRGMPVAGGERMVYDADGTGVIVGLTTFGSEVVALHDVISPDSAINEPLWLGDARTMPKVGQPVTVRIQPVMD